MSASHDVGRTASARFAAAIAQRHGAGTRARRTLARVFLRAARERAGAGGVRVLLAPRIELHVATLGSRSSSAPASRAQRREAPPTASAPSAAPIVQRVLARARRAEETGAAAVVSAARQKTASPTAQVAAAMPAGSAHAAPPVARVLRQRAPAAAQPAGDDGWGQPIRQGRAPAARPAELSPAEVGRLTDHIVHTIDRRISAFRERHGKGRS